MKFWVELSQQYWNSTTLIYSYSLQHWFISTSWNWTTLTHSYALQHWFISTGCNEYEYNVHIKLITLEICLIHTPTHSDSNDLNHSSKFTVLVVAAFPKKKEERRKKKTKTASKANTQPSNEYCSIRMRIILILWFFKKLGHGESTSCVLLSMSTMCTSNFEYE